MGDGTPVAGNVVYAISNGSMVKIGRTTNISERLAALQHGSGLPLTLLGITSGGADEEKMLHKMFAHRRCSGEWFELSETDVLVLSNILHKPTAAEMPQRRTPARADDWLRMKPLTIRHFALLDVGRRENLGSLEMLLLVILLMVTNERTRTWKGNRKALAEEARISGGGIAVAFRNLQPKGVIDVITPFRRGHDGEVRVTCYTEIVVPRKNIGRLLN